MISAHGTAEPPRLLEREAALERLDAANTAAATHGLLLLVHGEAGVGKTALVRSFCDGMPGTRILWGTCDALFTPRPLGPLLDVAENVSEH